MIINVQQQLEKCVANLSSNIKCYVQYPSRNISRSSLLSFEKMIWAFLQMGGKSLSKELDDLGLPVSNSAFSQKRYQIKSEALQQLFYDFTSEITPVQDMPIFAVDGSNIHIRKMPNDSDSYFPPCTRAIGHNLLHLNALYDLRHEIYYDAFIQKRRTVYGFYSRSY